MGDSLQRKPSSWRGKSVAIVGFGREGQAMAEYLLERGAYITICEEKEPREIGDAYRRFQGRNIQWRLGPRYLQGLENFSVIVRSPGVSLSLGALQAARVAGAEITSLTKIFFSECPAPIIGVTGTKGKGTTATLIAEMLKKSRRTVHLVGNIGVPAITVLPKIKKNHWVVYELSSFQLADLTQSPHIAVVLGMTVDHQDYHKTPRDYFLAKSSIVKYQKADDAAVFVADYRETRRMEKFAKGKIFEASRKKSTSNGSFATAEAVIRAMSGHRDIVTERRSVALKGDHNLENVTAAVVAATLAGATLPAIRQVIKTFRGLPHRLEPLGTIDGVEFWNNSYAVIPEATIAAIRAFSEPVILLAGGYNRRQTADRLAAVIVKSKVKVVVGIGETAASIMRAVRKAAQLKKKRPPAFVEGGKTMTEMVATARKFAKPGDVILLSPGAPSFDRFKDYTDRGEQFRTAVEALKK